MVYDRDVRGRQKHFTVATNRQPVCYLGEALIVGDIRGFTLPGSHRQNGRVNFRGDRLFKPKRVKLG